MTSRRVAQALAGAILTVTVIASGAAPATAATDARGHGSVVVPTDTGWGII